MTGPVLSTTLTTQALAAVDRAAFERALAVTLELEGGRVDDPVDRGGRTAYGIAQRTYDAWRRTQHLPARDVWLITPPETHAIYWLRYWLGRGRCAALARISGAVAGAHFDACVHHGPRGVGRETGHIYGANVLLQLALESLGYRLAIDGLIGPVTLRAVAAVSYPPNLVDGMCAERARYMARIIARDPTQQRFAKNWYSRVATIRLTYAGRA